MERFSQEFRSRFDHPALLDEIESGIDRVWGRRRERLYLPDLTGPSMSSIPIVPVKVLLLMQMAIRRSAELADSMIRDASAFAYTPVWTSSRSIFELAALMWDMKERVRELLQKWDSKLYDQFTEHTDAVLLGFKSTDWHPQSRPQETAQPAPQQTDPLIMARNVLTLIDRITKQQIPRFRAMYDLLSEVAHPNYMGMMEAYTIIREPIDIELVDTPVPGDPQRVKIPLEAAETSLEMLAQSIESYDGWFADFVALCRNNNPPPSAVPPSASAT